jgi:hypothetical protein
MTHFFDLLDVFDASFSLCVYVPVCLSQECQLIIWGSSCLPSCGGHKVIALKLLVIRLSSFSEVANGVCLLGAGYGLAGTEPVA